MRFDKDYGYASGLSGTIGAAAAYQFGDLDQKMTLAAAWRERRAELLTSADQLYMEADEIKRKEFRLGILRGLSSLIKESKPTISKPDGSAIHKLIKSGLAGRLYDDRSSVPNNSLEKEKDAWSHIRDNVNTFVIERDWAAVIAGRIEGDFIFPYSCCAFEMTVCGRRGVYIHDDERDVFCAQINGEWIGMIVDESFRSVEVGTSFIYNQVRAVCVLLDAEVAAAPVTRAPHLQDSRRKKTDDLPLYDYRTIQLTRHPHGGSLPQNGEIAKSKRLHFRRGHWRHFQTHKTWIKWMLVGDPDLGFIDKHYRI